MMAANNDKKCVGIITWMHTFSPAKMWIHGLQQLKKPLLHFHTQYNAEIPWDTMDMDFMNLNQSAHGDREFGHICARMRKPRKVVSGYWKDERPQQQIAIWARVAAAWADAHDMRILRFGDQMNNVAVTDGDKVEAEIRLGYHIDYYPVSSLIDYYMKVTDAEADELVEEYKKLYTIKIDESGEEIYWKKVHNAAKQEIAIRRVLQDEGAKGFTARLVFDSKVGKGVTATIVDMGNRFRLIVNDVECIKPKPLPKLPVANALWIPMPNFEIGTATWIMAGGTHHSCFSYDITPEFWIDYAEIAEIEMLRIDKDTTYGNFRHQLQYNEVYYMLNKALK